MPLAPFVTPRRAAMLLTGTVALTLMGCATVGTPTPEQQVQERASAFWQARIKGDLPTAYGLLTPAYRGLRSQEDYAKANGKQIALEKIEVTKVACEKEKCTATIAMTGKPVVPGLSLPELTNYMDDTWVLDDGQWWRFETP